MKKVFSLVWVISVFLLGCTVRTYKITKDRVDQEISGNRGYLQGSPKEQVFEKKPTRTVQQVEVELPSVREFKKLITPRKTRAKLEDKELWGNLGYIERKTLLPEAKEEISLPKSIEKYKVENGDTLQKISQKFYGSTRLWYRIYEANKDIIKDPNKIYPGQVINIPVEKKKEPQENLK